MAVHIRLLVLRAAVEYQISHKHLLEKPYFLYCTSWNIKKADPRSDGDSETGVMRVTNPWEHQSWYQTYTLAVHETDPGKLLERIVAAQSGIISRIIAVRNLEIDESERNALEEAQRVLSLLVEQARV